jgi:arsenite methyltransferase
MNNPEEIKELIKQRYTEIAVQGHEFNSASCCGAGGCGDGTYTIMADDYKDLKGYNKNADLGLGCGLPTEFAKIKSGDTVVDLGSGAGNDCFVARSEAGESGRIIGIDMTPIMIEKAKENAAKLGYDNMEFYLGDIENIPLDENTADVVVSNCVLNLVPDKTKAFSEIHRILKPGGHFSVSDIVLTAVLPEKLRTAAEMYAGCVAGALFKNDYMEKIKQAGFKNIIIQKEKPIIIPAEILANYLSTDELASYKKSRTGIYSITVYAEK